jgi:hypothetical protein
LAGKWRGSARGVRGSTPPQDLGGSGARSSRCFRHSWCGCPSFPGDGATLGRRGKLRRRLRRCRGSQGDCRSLPPFPPRRRLPEILARLRMTAKGISSGDSLELRGEPNILGRCNAARPGSECKLSSQRQRQWSSGDPIQEPGPSESCGFLLKLVAECAMTLGHTIRREVCA